MFCIFVNDGRTYERKSFESICPRTSVIVFDSSVSLTLNASSNLLIKAGTTSECSAARLERVSSMRTF